MQFSNQATASINVNAVDDYADALIEAMGGQPSAGHRRLLWAEQEYGLSSQPDAVLLDASVRSILPSQDRDYAPSISYTQARDAFAHRNLRGLMHNAAAKRSPELAGKPRPAAPCRWPLFGLTWMVDTAADITGAWALALTLNGEYAEAHEVISAARGSSPLLHVATLSLYYESARWGDLRDAAGRIRAEVGDSDPLLATAASALLGMAYASLGQDEPAALALDVAARSELVDVSAWALYVLALIKRTFDGKEPEAQTLLARSLSIKHTTWAAGAQSNDERTLRVTTEANIALRTDRWDVTTEPDPKMEREREAKANREAYRARAQALLDRQVGMENVKDSLNRITNVIRVNQERVRRGGDPKTANYNLVLTGPPGTGKFTIVEAYTLRLAAEGIVDDPKPMVTGKADFVSNVVGGSAPLTTETVNKARGKVLFIDEFYSLVQGGKDTLSQSNTDSFGMEAIDTLVGEMDTRIGQTVFIVAGYPDDIRRVMQVNDGLEGRLPRRIEFETFSLQQFAAVARKEAEDRHVRLSDEVIDFLTDENGPARRLLVQADENRTVMDKLGNGRFARNLVERSIEEQAQRLSETDLAEISEDEMARITVADVLPAFEAYLNSALHGGSTE